ncbi:uncharacterized protein LOC128188166 [Crassostrea angulata]|uniref:uncharacterized protein LOC128188166 n=1 Tax=Magallana angulata TaxID=2784310 RepID=UPI0022B187D3|nr:uncharacterized protein LOC128188166 [Crassostrea angulata]
MMLFISLFIILGLSWQDQCVCISTRFNSGTVTFEWTKPSNITIYDIMTIRDRKHDNWTQVTDNTFDVSDALLFDSISIIVTVPGLKSEINNTLTYTVLKVKVQNGKSANLSWVAPYFPIAKGYTVYHKDNTTKEILKIDGKDGPGESDKYKYLTKPYNSTNIMLEVKDVTLGDAGYFNGGADEKAATSGGGVVLIVYDKPKKPEIRGDLSVLINTSSELTCSSQSTSAPDYYSKLATLSYTWFVNDTKMGEETNQTLRLKVTRGHKYNNYSCKATEYELESDWSDTVQIESLYGPDKITITPHPNTSMQDNGMVTIREGETFGPYQCLVDCHPPCNVTWTYMNSTGHLEVISKNGNLSLPQINKDIKLFKCVATWGTETKKEKNITLNVQYLGEPLILVNNSHSSDTNMDLQENIPFNVSCLVDGNPIPNVRLTKGSENISTNSKNTKWANHTFVSAGCADAGNYTCVGGSEGFGVSEKTFRINILCNVRIDDSIPFHKKYGSPSGINVRVASVIPVIANPIPQYPAIKWVGPGTEQIHFNVSGRGVPYRHWINTSFPVYNHSYFGNYTMIYGDETILTITISERGLFFVNKYNCISICSFYNNYKLSVPL